MDLLNQLKKSLIAEFTNIDGANGIKFQPFKYDEIALPDFPWYDVYVKLFFKEEQWKEIIKETEEFAKTSPEPDVSELWTDITQ